MTVTTEATTINTDAILSALPAEVRVEARLRLAAYAEATTAEQRAAVQARIVDETLKAAAEGNWCQSAEAALTLAFGEPEGGSWVYSDGFDRHGYDREGYNRDGFHRDNGRNRDGFDRQGFDADGYNVDGLDRHGFNREGLDKDGRSAYRFNIEGWDPDGFNREGFNRDGFDRDGYNIQGEDREGRNRAGEDRFRYDRHGSDRYGYNHQGIDRNGYPRAQNEAENRPPYVRTDHPLYKEYETWYNSPANTGRY